MTRPVFIYSGNFREAVEIARVYRLFRPQSWEFLESDRQLRGTRGARVLRTPCVLELRASIPRERINQALIVTEADVIDIECPYG